MTGDFGMGDQSAEGDADAWFGSERPDGRRQGSIVEHRHRSDARYGDGLDQRGAVSGLGSGVLNEPRQPTPSRLVHRRDEPEMHRSWYAGVEICDRAACAMPKLYREDRCERVMVVDGQSSVAPGADASSTRSAWTASV